MKHAIPDDWDHETFCRFAICWPDSVQWRALLRGLVTEPARGFFWDEKTGWIKDVLADFRQTMDHNIELWEVIMACGDTGLKELAAAIRLLAANQCCEGSPPSNGGIQLTVNVGGQDYPVFGTQPPIDLPESGKPEDYPGTVEEYDADKCRTATKIVNDAIATLRALSFIQWGVNTLSIAIVIACFVGAISVPLVFIPGLIAVCAGLVGVQGIISAEADWIEAHKQEWVCAFYNHSTVAAIASSIHDLIETMVTSLGWAGAIGYTARVILSYIFSTDTINQLFTMVQGQGPEADCSECLPQWIIGAGTLVDGDLSTEFTIQSVHRNAGEGYFGAPARQDMILIIPGNEHPCWQVSVSVSGWVSGGFGVNGHDWSYYDCADAYHAGMGMPDVALSNICVGHHTSGVANSIHIIGADANVFQATFTVSGNCT